MMSGPATHLQDTTRGPAHRWWVLAAVEIGNFVVYMDGFIVTLALPAMSRHFGVGIHEVKWVIVAYLATMTVTLLVAGRLADLWGRKQLTVLGMALLTLGALLCAVAPTLGALIVFRIVQGLGGALVLANVMAVITAVFPRQERPRAMGINSTVLAMGQVTGLVLGGFLIGWLGWPSIFLVIGAIGGLGLLLDLAVLRGEPADPDASMDWRGAVLSMAVIGAPFLVVEHLSRGLTSPVGGALLLAGLALLGLFVLAERRPARPLLDLRLFRRRAFTCGSAAVAFYFVAATSCYFLVPLYAQLVLGLSPLTAGLLLVPLSVALTASSQLVGHLGGRLSARMVSTAGLICTSTAVLALSTLGSTATYLDLIGPAVLVGIGGGLFHPPNNVSVLGAVPREYLGAANGFFTMARTFGQAIGVAVAATILAAGLGPTGDRAPAARAHDAVAEAAFQDAFVQAQALAYRVAAALGLVGAVISALRGGEVQQAPRADETRANQDDRAC
jgi:EmrB/QacA subfamily drug resistance transporter